MNPIKNLLLLVLCAGVTGSAQSIEQSRNLGTLTPAVARQNDSHGVPGVSTAYSFLNFLNTPAAADARAASTGTRRPAPSAMDARQPPVADSEIGPFASVGTLSPLRDEDWPIDGARSELKVAFSAGDFPGRTTQNAGAGPREGPRLAAAAVTEPSEWMQLLCGLAFVAFVARRRTQPPTG
jgi:hypothetical protein